MQAKAAVYLCCSTERKLDVECEDLFAIDGGPCAPFQDIWEPAEVRRFREPIRSIACGGSHSLACNIRGELFAWGNGSSGQLGVGRIVDLFVPTGVASLGGVFAVAAGDDYSACLVAPTATADQGTVFAEAGNVWTWGSCEAGKLGHEGISSGLCVAPKRVRLSTPISRVACGEKKDMGLIDSNAPFGKISRPAG